MYSLIDKITIGAPKNLSNWCYQINDSGG